MNSMTKFTLIAAVAASLSACGGGGGTSSNASTTTTTSSGSAGSASGGSSSASSYSIGGTVSGLNGSVALALNGAAQSVSSDGSFIFNTALATGTAYTVTVSTPPSGETCTVGNGTGTVGSSSVNNVTVSCSVPFNSSVPAPTYASGSFQLEYFTKLNAVRQALGLGLLAQNDTLDTAAQAHALYLAVNYNPSTMNGVDPSTGDLYFHSEDSGMTDFYAATPAARDIKAGFSGVRTDEVGGPAYGTGTEDADASISGLLNTVYHREGILADNLNSIGIGVDAASNANDQGGYFVSDMGGVSNEQTLASGTMVVYPANGATDAAPYFNNAFEAPSPLPSLGTQGLGGPISVQVASTDTLSVTSFTLTDASGNDVPVVLSTSQTDQSGDLRANYAFITPTAPLTPGEKYTASFTGADGSAAVSKTWSFTTVAAISVVTQGPYVVHNGQSLVVEVVTPSSMMSESWSDSLSSSQLVVGSYGTHGMTFTVPSGAVTSATTFSVTISDQKYTSVQPVTISVTVEP
jgi:uncharacterized protein YkwD